MKSTIAMLGIAALGLLYTLFGITVIDPGERGTKVTLGTMDSQVLDEGVHHAFPGFSQIQKHSIKQTTVNNNADVYSSDLQPVKIKLAVLYKLPEASVIPVAKEYAGKVTDSLLFPRVQEALKETVSSRSAEQIVKGREQIKQDVIVLTRRKLGTLLEVVDIVILDVDLSDKLEKAIEEKMVQEQQAAKAKFAQTQAAIDADTAIIKAKGEAEAIRVQGQALKETPGLIELRIVEKWDGKAPLVVGGGQGVNILLPIGDKQPTKK